MDQLRMVVHVRFPACLPDCLSMQTAKTFTPG